MRNWPNRTAIAAVGVAALLHFAGLAVILRGVRFSPFLQSFPLLTGDYALYFARALRTVAFLSSSHRFWGYDPFSMAGYPFNAVHETGSLLFSFLAASTSPLIHPGPALLVVELISLFLLPLPMFAFVRRLAGEEAAGCSLVLTVLMYGRFGLGSIDPYVHGFLPFQMGCFLSLWQVSLLWSWIEGNRKGPFVPFAALAVIIPMLHPGAVLVSVSGAAFTLLAYRRRLRWTHLNCLIVAGAVALAVNGIWMRVFFAFRSWVVDTPYYEPMSVAHVWRQLIPRSLSFVALVSVSFNFYLFAAAISGVRRLRKLSPLRFNAIVPWGLVMAAIGFGGRSFGLSGAFGAGRYIIPFELMLYALAGLGVAPLLADRRGRMTVAVLGVTLLSAAAMSDYGDVLRSRRKFVNIFPPEQEEIIRFLQGPGRVDGRTLVECEQGNQPHFLDPLPLLTGAHVLGGTNVGNFLKNRFTVFSMVEFENGRKTHGNFPNVFGRRISEMSPEEFESFLRTYDVRQIIGSSVETKVQLFLKSKVLEPGEALGASQVFRVRRPGHWLIEGQGNVAADFDHIVITNASKGKLILSFHWIKTLVSTQAVPIKPVLLPGFPVEFIEIDNSSGASRIDITNAGL